MLIPANAKSRSYPELMAIQQWLRKTYGAILEARMPIRIEVTDNHSTDEPMYAVRDFLTNGETSLMQLKDMPVWMREKLALLMVNKEHMFEIENVGFCYDEKTFYIKSEEVDDEQAHD